VTVSQLVESVLLCGAICSAVLKPVTPVSSWHADSDVHDPDPGGMMLRSYQGVPSESTENSATVVHRSIINNSVSTNLLAHKTQPSDADLRVASSLAPLRNMPT
jgi:hypothetical protein